jgi:hypothetical protein
MSRVRSFGIATKLRTVRQGFESRQGNFYIPHSFEAGSEALAPCSLNTATLSPGGEAAVA